MTIYFLLQFELQEPQASISTWQALWKKSRKFWFTKDKEFYQVVQKTHTHVYTHYRAEENHWIENSTKNRYT